MQTSGSSVCTVQHTLPSMLCKRRPLYLERPRLTPKKENQYICCIQRLLKLTRPGMAISVYLFDGTRPPAARACLGRHHHHQRNIQGVSSEIGVGNAKPRGLEWLWCPRDPAGTAAASGSQFCTLILWSRQRTCALASHQLSVSKFSKISKVYDRMLHLGGYHGGL